MGSRRAGRCQVILATVALLFAPAIVSARQEATGARGWADLPEGASFQPFTNGTADDLLVASVLVAVSRITAEPGSGELSFCNDRPGFVGPRMLYVEEGSLDSGPRNVSPGSSPGPSLLVRAPEAGQRAEPAVLIPRNRVTLEPGDLAFYPADTAYAMSNEAGGPTAKYSEINVFPIPVLAHEESELVVAGMTAQPLSLDLGVTAAFPPAPRS